MKNPTAISQNPLRIEFRPYKRPFRRPIETAHGLWSEREGVIVRLESEDGRVGFGEAAPIPSFSAESPDQVRRRLTMIGERICMDDFASLADGLPSLGWALDCALAQIVRTDSGDLGAVVVAGLLPAGETALTALPDHFSKGWRTFKWKIGVLPAAEELAVANELAASLPDGAKLRLDANGGLAGGFPAWLDWCAQHVEIIDYLEQPLPPGFEGEMLADGYAKGVPIALDESVAGVGALTDLSARFPQATMVVKPSLLGSMWQFLDWRTEYPEVHLVYSSGFETAVGFRAAFGLASIDPQPRPSGFGVVEFLEDDGLCPVEVGSRLVASDFPDQVEEAVWKQL
ncbi:MAG: o-succinylbenzoate synthase [Verrucomicrobiota bacterium]